MEQTTKELLVAFSVMFLVIGIVFIIVFQKSYVNKVRFSLVGGEIIYYDIIREEVINLHKWFYSMDRGNYDIILRDANLGNTIIEKINGLGEVDFILIVDKRYTCVNVTITTNFHSTFIDSKSRCLWDSAYKKNVGVKS